MSNRAFPSKMSFAVDVFRRETLTCAIARKILHFRQHEGECIYAINLFDERPLTR